MGRKGIALILMLLVLIPAAAFSQDLEKARIGYMKGDVQISTKDNPEDWFAAAVNTPLQEGDRIWVPAGGRNEVQILGGVVIRLDAATSFDILSLGEDSYQFYLNVGRTYINNRRYGVEHIQVDTPLSSISCYDNSLVMIDAAESGATEISVLSGEAYVETSNGKIRVTAGNTLRISEDLAAEFLPLNSPDEWEQWNRDRDRMLADGGASLRYLPEELDDYVSDFDANGSWLYASDYGYVWAPRVSLSVGWAPYRVGRWVWIGGDYVWISGEPWGWAPYHYGRWIFISKAGWCWVPPRRGQVYWAPGYVGWVHTPTDVSWVPLGPGDRYYARRRYSPDTVTTANLTVGLAGTSFRFRNMNVKNAVTVQPRDTFLTGRKTSFRTKENPFTRKDALVGPPTFTPQRATMSPAIRTIPKSKLPPARVRSTTVESLKMQRKVVPDQRGSVFAPGQSVREMPVTTGEQPRRLQREQRPENFPQTQRKIRQEEKSGKGLMKQPAAPVQPRGQTPQAAPAPVVRQPAAPGQQFRGRPVTPAQPQAQPARIERQAPKAQPADTIRQPAARPQTRSIEMKKERIPQTPARVQTPQAPVRVQTPLPTRPAPAAPAPAARQPVTPAQPKAQPARIERQQVQKPGDRPVSPDQGGQPAANPGRQMRQGAGWRQ
ncbi:MAG: DUF6600 domain-containing protein [Geobacteraceae bacterium]|nr:DUF6600 domain-containing protein [Geobacteraceae bacterium]